MGTFEVSGLAPPDVEAITKQWRLQSGEPFNEEYARDFAVKDIRELWRSRRGVKPPQLQSQVDGPKRVVNVRIVAQ